MPYGVWGSALGMTSPARRSTSGETGAPADISRRTLRSAARCEGVMSDAVAATLARAAGEANTSDAPIDSAAAPSAAAVSEPGEVTSMSGTTEAMPMAGP